MKKRLLFYIALSVSLLSLLTIIILAAGISGTSANSDSGIRVSYTTSVALLGFTAGMALNIYYFITYGRSDDSDEEKTRILEKTCLNRQTAENSDDKYILLLVRPCVITSQREIIGKITKPHGYVFPALEGRLVTIIVEDCGKSPEILASETAERTKDIPCSVVYYPEAVTMSGLYDAYATAVQSAEKLFFLPSSSTAAAINDDGTTIPYATLLQNIENAMQNLKRENYEAVLNILDSTEGNIMACRFVFFMISSFIDQHRLLINPAMHPGAMDTRDFASFSELRKYLEERITAFLDDKETRAEQSRQPYIEQINSLIEKHLADSGYGVQQIADDLKLSPAYLSRVYKDRTGRNIIDAITEMRMEKAEDLLISSDKTITEICSEAGYSSSSYFHRVFRKKHLISPGEYRQRMKERGQ